MTEDLREKAQLEQRGPDEADEIPETLMVARYVGTGHGGSYAGLRVATADDVKRLRPRRTDG